MRPWLRVTLLALAGFVLAAEASAWWNASWSHRRKLTFDNSGQPVNFANFPVLVVLNSARIDYSKTKNDGSDLRFVDADGVTLLDHEIEKWDEVGNSYVWVRVPQVDASSNADFIWMYYGNPAAAALPLANQQATWTATYVMVQHLQEVSPNPHLDSTVYGNNSSVIDVQAQASPLGKIDGADIFNSASTDNIDVPDSATLDMTATDSFTVEAWIKTSSSGQQMVVSKEDAGSEYQLWVDGGVATFWLNDGVDNARVSAAGPTVDDGLWHYIVGRWSDGSNTAEIFVDGVSQGAVINPLLDAMSSASPLVIGEEGDADRSFNFSGTIDEVRVRKSSLSVDDWILAQFLSMNDSGIGLVGSFVTFGPEAAHCCALGVTETATTITVNGPNRFDIRFNTATGGSIDRFVDAEENTGFDLAGGIANGEGMPNAVIVQGGIWHAVAQNENGAQLHLLEATPARVRIRQEAFYEEEEGATILAGLKGTGDFSVYAIGRFAWHWLQRATSNVGYTEADLNLAVHYQSSGPLNAWAPYSQSGTGFGAAARFDDFTLLKSETANARTDFLHIAYRDWSIAEGHLQDVDSLFNFSNAVQERRHIEWRELTGGTIAAGAGPYSQQAGETWNFLTYFKPTNLGAGASPWLDAAVTSRSTDYRTPSAVTSGPGFQWQDPSENTSLAGDYFNEAEAAYVFDLDPASGLTLTLDGSTTTRRSPFFKIRRWQSFVESPAVTFDPDGPGATPASALQPRLDYRAAVKPVTRAYLTPDLLWYSSFENSGKVNPPVVGDGTGTIETGIGYAAGRYGNGAVFDAATDDIQVILQPNPGSPNIELDRGRIEFWFKPNWAPTDGAEHYFFDIDPDGLAGNASRIRMKKEAAGLSNAINAEVYDSTGTNRGVTIPITNYSWRAGDWIHLAMEWDSGAATNNVRAYLNGAPLTPSATANGTFTMLAETASGILRIGNRAVTPGFFNADGIMDEFRIYSGSPNEIAHAGLLSDGRERLANRASNTALALLPVDGNGRGRYLFFGLDSMPRGFNVSLATPGVGVADNQVQWFFWNGTDWQAVFPADGTNSFKQTGTIWWNPDWPGWAPYSIGGGPDLYYMMARLNPGAAYSTPPVERVIKSDILLFQYCPDVTTANATFAFAVPPTTEVKLESFTAQPGDGSVLLEWRTGSELSNLGFHLYRGLSESGPWTRLSSSLIPGLGSSAVGQAYSFRDSGLLNGTRYFYRLDDLDASSKTTSHGPVSAVPSAGTPADEGPGASGSGGRTEGSGSTPSGCPQWVLSAYGAAGGASRTGLRCTRHGDPEAVSLEVLSRDARSATLELRTGGFYALHGQPGAGEPSGTVRVFVPGFDFPQDDAAAALPIRRALVEAVVGRRVELGGVRALDLVGFRGLVPSVLGKAEMEVSWDGTARAVRRRVRREAVRAERGRARGAEPIPDSELVRLLPSVFQGETKSAVVEMAPLRFDARRQQLVLAKRVRLRLLFSGREAGESGRGSQGRSPRSRRPAVTGEVLARLFTTRQGLHAVAFEELFPGRQRGFAASHLRLERQGEPVGFRLEPATRTFGPGSRLFFHADQTARSTDYSSELAYELVSAPDGVVMPLQSATPGGRVVATASTVWRAFETNRFYQPGLLEAPDPWLWGALVAGATRVESATLSGVDTSGTAGLEVFLQGASESGSAVDHHVSVSLNGMPLGEAQFAGKQPYRIRMSLPASLLREGPNELQLTNVGDTGVASLVFLDRFELSHPQTASLVGGRFEGTWSESGTVTVAGASGALAVLDTTPAAASGGGGPRWLTGYSASGGTLRFEAEAGHRYVVASAAGWLSPRVERPVASTLRAVTNQAEYILVAPQAFLAAAEPLVERRRDQGLQARAVAFEEIAAEFGHGLATAEAIHEFLAYAYQSWARPSPRYVLLLGDSSYDPRSFMGSSFPAPLPALWTKTSYLWTVSDPQLAAVNGEDSVPDLAIGRLPASTVAQADELVQKLLAWEDSGQGLGGPAVLVADNPDLAGDFEADAEDIAGSYLAGRAQLLRLSELGAATRPAILDALNGGLSQLSYVGHGGAAVWASENVWNSWDAASLQAQALQPLLVTMNCLNGYFVAPAFDSLAESLLKAQGRGAIAAFSPSGLSVDGPAHQYHRALMAELTSGTHARLGDAILAAQHTYAESGLMPELLSVYHLLGDPAMSIRPGGQ